MPFSLAGHVRPWNSQDAYRRRGHGKDDMTAQRLPLFRVFIIVGVLS